MTESAAVESFVLKPGLAWYAGVQQGDNSVGKPPPPRPYLCEVRADTAQRAWYTAHVGSLSTPPKLITVVYYVDPSTKHMYAQPHPNTAEASMPDWDVSEPRAPLPFELARETARWIYKVSRSRLAPKSRRSEDDLAEWWHGYVTSPTPIEPPVPLGIPIDPSRAYRQQGWVDAKDWVKKPGKGANEKDEEDEINEAAV